MPAETADLFRDHRKLLLRIRAGWTPPGKRRPPALGLVARITTTLVALLAVGAGLDFFMAGRYTPFVVVMTLAALLIVGVLAKPRPDADTERRQAVERQVYDSARRYAGRYVLREDLDEGARRLMARTSAAIDSVLESHVHAEGLLDDVRNTVMLPAQEWEIARLLAKLSELRAGHRQVVGEGVTPEVAAVAEPLAQALDSSERAVVARIEALERYAGHVADAERAYRAREQIARLGAQLPRYEELLAESGADDSAVPELKRLSDDADRLEQALRDSVTSAHEAFRHLRG
ncbi:hypothetical protein OUY22_17570 [Nonomuraea sp. MCN248]|uniref:Uncharacterized protein n=1 Tax=Nonomuraea corallina TaxID=2989783 RepID=A0ABT4SDF4_9ACTN|nr:hypothetical protein [Nonomuraea corallina]MDA0635232.1 hypothetical protein [Nonomuraea corallina]